MSDSHTGTTADADPDAGVDVAFSADAAFAELAALAMSAQPLREILQRTVALARTVVSSTSAVSVTVIAGDDATTPAATADVAGSLDRRGSGKGPPRAPPGPPPPQRRTWRSPSTSRSTTRATALALTPPGRARSSRSTTSLPSDGGRALQTPHWPTAYTAPCPCRS